MLWEWFRMIFFWKKQLTFSLLANSLLNGWTFQQVGLILRLIGCGPPDCPGHDFSGDSGFLKNHSSSQKNMVVFIAIIKWGPGPTLATLASKVRFEWLLWSSYSQPKNRSKIGPALGWLDIVFFWSRQFGIFGTKIVCSWAVDRCCGFPDEGMVTTLTHHTVQNLGCTKPGK